MPSVYQDALSRARSGIFRSGPDATYADGDDSSWMDIDWPSMTRRLEIEGRGVGVVDCGGDGPPLLFIHGLGGIWQNWLLNIPAFMDSHRCVAVDLPGFGLSEKPDECSIRGLAGTVDRVCEELDIVARKIQAVGVMEKARPVNELRSLVAQVLHQHPLQA